MLEIIDGDSTIVIYHNSKQIYHNDNPNWRDILSALAEAKVQLTDIKFHSVSIDHPVLLNPPKVIPSLEESLFGGTL